MPVMGGIEALKVIRSEEKETSGHTIIIALTADALKGTEEQMLNEGFDYYLSKPYMLKELVDMLQMIKEGK
jgi:CheY-like chemotaxis protein